MPQKGDKLFNIWNGKLEKVTFLEESLAGMGATIKTWEIKYPDGKKARCSMGMYCLSEKDAWEKYLKEINESIPSLILSVRDALESLADANNERIRTETILKKL